MFNIVTHENFNDILKERTRKTNMLMEKIEIQNFIELVKIDNTVKQFGLTPSLKDYICHHNSMKDLLVNDVISQENIFEKMKKGALIVWETIIRVWNWIIDKLSKMFSKNNSHVKDIKPTANVSNEETKNKEEVKIHFVNKDTYIEFCNSIMIMSDALDPALDKMIEISDIFYDSLKASYSKKTKKILDRATNLTQSIITDLAKMNMDNKVFIVKIRSTDDYLVDDKYDTLANGEIKKENTLQSLQWKSKTSYDFNNEIKELYSPVEKSWEKTNTKFLQLKKITDKTYPIIKALKKGYTPPEWQIFNLLSTVVTNIGNIVKMIYHLNQEFGFLIDDIHKKLS